MPIDVRKTCAVCDGAGIIQVSGGTMTCPVCVGSGKLPTTIDVNLLNTTLNDLDDKLNDIMDKCDDIFEQVS